MLTPTFIYTNLVNNLKNKFEIKGIVNITGGGLTENTPRVFPEDIICEIDLSSWKKPNIFKLIQEKGNLDIKEMLRTFNNGIGMVFIISEKDSSDFISEIEKHNHKGSNIGKIIIDKNNKEKVIYKGDYYA